MQRKKIIYYMQEFLGQIANLLGSICVMWFISVNLKPEDFGLFTFFITISALLVYFYNCLHLVTLRQFSNYEHRNELDKLFVIHRDFLKICHISVVVMGTIGSIACLAMGNYSIFILSVITTLYSIIAGMNIHYLGFQLAAKLNTANLNSRALLPVARFLAIIVCITFFGRDLVTLYVSFMLGTLIIVGYQYYIYQAYVTHVEALRLPGDSTIQIVQSNNQEENATWLYFMSLASMCFFGFIQNNGEKLLLGAMLIPELMGVFSILNLTGYSMMFILLGFLTQSIMPSLFARTSDNIKESNWNSLLLLNKYIGIFALITFTCTVISFFTSSLFFHMILRTEYHDYASWHPWMVLAGGIFGISQLLLIPAQIVEQPNLQNNQRLINIVITLGLMTFSIAYLDFSGVLVSIVISNCLCLLVNGFFYVSILQRYKVRENAVKIELSFKRIA